MRIVINTSAGQDAILLAEYGDARSANAVLAMVIDQHIRALARDTTRREQQQAMNQREAELESLRSEV